MLLYIISTRIVRNRHQSCTIYSKQLFILLGRTSVPELAKGQNKGKETKEDNIGKDKQRQRDAETKRDNKIREEEVERERENEL